MQQKTENVQPETRWMKKRREKNEKKTHNKTRIWRINQHTREYENEEKKKKKLKKKNEKNTLEMLEIAWSNFNAYNTIVNMHVKY